MELTDTLKIDIAWILKEISRVGHHASATLHPETQLPTCRPGGYPILCWMELRYSWYCSNAISAQLCKLVALGSINVYKAIHVANAETLSMGLRRLLPLRPQTINQIRSVAIRINKDRSQTCIVTHLPVWLLCLMTFGCIAFSPRVVPVVQLPIPSKE